MEFERGTCDVSYIIEHMSTHANSNSGSYELIPVRILSVKYSMLEVYRFQFALFDHKWEERVNSKAHILQLFGENLRKKVILAT